MADVSWTTFPTAEHPSEWIRPGDDVSQSDLDVSDEEYAELKALGAIRDVPYPIPKDPDTGEFVFFGSPREYALAQLAQMSQEEYDASVVNLGVVSQLQDRARKAMDETGYDETAPPSEEAQAEAAATEAAQGTRNVEPAGGAKVTNKASSSAKDK